MSKPSAQKILMPVAWVFAITVAAISLLAGSSHVRRQTSNVPNTSAEQQTRIRAQIDTLPLAFEANLGQTDPQVKYMARSSGYTVFLTKDETVFAVSSRRRMTENKQKIFGKTPAAGGEATTAAIHMTLVDRDPHAQISANQELPGVTNYFIGDDPSRWQRGLKHYAGVKYRGVYPGVDLAFHGQQGQVEFDFILAPQANASSIRFGISGARQITTDTDGNLVLTSAAGDLRLQRPVAYQLKGDSHHLVDARFTLSLDNTVGFALGNYDHGRELVIDPTMSFSTFLGGASEDEVFGIAVDPSNNVYVTGESSSTSGFPGGNVPAGHQFDSYVTQLKPNGSSGFQLGYTTFVGGSGNDSGLAVAVDSSGSAYVAGHTESPDFPVPGSAAQPTATNLGTNCTNLKTTIGPCSDAFAYKLLANGAMSWSTFIGGENDDTGYAIALDGAGNVWVAGDTFSTTFYPNTHAASFLNVSLNNGVAQTPAPDDGFVVEINPTGTAPFMYSTYLGGSFGDQANGIAIDSSNNVYVVGETASTDFPATKGAYQTGCGSDGNCNTNTNGFSYYDAFVTKLVSGSYANTGGYSTYIGGSSDDYGFAIAVDGSGNAYITGETTADDTTTTPGIPYPTTSGAYNTTYNSKATSNAFVTELNSTGSSLAYSTFLGGSVQDLGGGIAVDSFGDAYVTGMTMSADFPVTANAVQSKLNGSGSTNNSDAFVSQFLAGGKTLFFSTYLGGSGDENANASGSVGTIALDSSNEMWVGGSTNSGTDFPTKNPIETTYGGNPYDGFITEYSSGTVPNYVIAATTPSAISPGTSATSTVTLTSLFKYNSAVTLTCSVTGTGSPAPSCGASSAFSTNPVTPTGAGATSTLTVTTTGASAAVNRNSKIFYAMFLPVVGLSLIGMRFTGATGKKRMLGLLLLGIVIGMLFLLPACGGGSGGGGGGGGGGCSGCTPAGSYTVTITGTDSNKLSNSTQVTLTVN